MTTSKVVSETRTRQVPVRVTRRVPYTVTRRVARQVSRQIEVTCTKMVPRYVERQGAVHDPGTGSGGGRVGGRPR
ncbi:MAG: hypothetical protein CM1200mP2_32300 [Planctomycetaceae bacterium]|nr:MAG: hypothetical protein CM1200mP2_32300 [Planctomycetaceae bacterium]